MNAINIIEDLNMISEIASQNGSPQTDSLTGHPRLEEDGPYFNFLS